MLPVPLCRNPAARRLRSSFFAGARECPRLLLAGRDLLASLQPSTSRRISSVCSPRVGDRSIFAGEADSLIGMPTLYHLPRCGWSSSTYISRPRTCSSLARSSVDMIGPQGTSSSLRIAINLALGVLRRRTDEHPPHVVLVLAAVADLRVSRIGWRVRAGRPRDRSLGERLPHRFLHHHVNVIVGAARPALDGVAELAAAGIVAGARRFGQAFGGTEYSDRAPRVRRW